MKERLIHWTVHRPWQSITLAIVLTLVLASGIRFIHIEDDMMKMLPENIPSRIVWNDIEKQFGATEGVYVSIGREGQSIFTPESMALIWDLTRAYEDLAIVDQVRSIASMSKIENVDGFLEVDDLMPARDLTTGEIAGIKAYLDRNPVVARMMVARTGDFANVMILALPGTSDEKLVTAIGQVQEAWAYGYDHHIGGLPYIRGLIAKFVRADVIGLMRIGLVLLVVVLLASLRSIPGLLMVLGIIILPVIAMMGFFGWVYHLTQSERFNFTILNSNMPIILLTIATADGVHIMTRFFREMRNRSDVKASVTATMDVLMLPVFLTSITTMAGFITLVTAPISSMMGYGLAVSFGIAWAWYLSVTLLPSVMALTKWDPSAKALTRAGRFERGIHHMGQVILRRPRLVLGTGIMVVLLSLVGITMLRVEVNIVKFFKP
ncbi:MAG: MMPL family transporter, partial [Candidatus Marinimicrobia bacterium]|nr:MMPL family transporter [Candidatus Neomarinimicrobiota bacterium]